MFRLNLSSIRPKLSKGADACTFRARLHFSYRQEDKRLSNAAYFLKVMTTQCWLALVMTAWIAPRLVSFEIADNALPILLSRPISRLGYVLGKFAALFAIHLVDERIALIALNEISIRVFLLDSASS